ncbi:hypothetical protein BH10ACT2_BH10ACT2_19620 [soil metagenome]
MRALSSLLCAASGTGLSKTVDRLAIGSSRLVVDLEHEICVGQVGDDRCIPAIEGDVPRMEQVVRLPRNELHEIWRATVTKQVKIIHESAEARVSVLALHQSWFNSDTNEFFSLVELEPLRGTTFDRVIVLVDDIYDMFSRLQGQDDLYHPAVLRRVAGLLGNLAFSGELSAVENEVLKAQLSLEATEHAVTHLLAWRRAEMIQAENLAHSLDAELTLIAVKHNFRALESLLDSRDAQRVYLSHRISEVRRMNKRTATLPDDLGRWPSVAEEVNRLHQGFAKNGHVLIMPTAIDELRFEGAVSRTSYRPYLASRWPLGEPTEDLIWRSPPVHFQHTNFFLSDGLPVDDPAASSVVRAVSNQIFFEIAFRDHYIVEHTPDLLVFRPFFYENFDTPVIDTDWSGGVRPEIDHWIKKMEQPPRVGSMRRAAFVHTDAEIKARLQWLHDPQHFASHFERIVQRHLRAIMTARKFPVEEIESLLAGQIQEPIATHLANNPTSHVARRGKSLVGWIESYALAAMHELFTTLDRPHRTDGSITGNMDVAILVRYESPDRKVTELGDIVSDLVSFYTGQAASDALNAPFWDAVQAAFVEEFGQTPSEAAFAAVNVERSNLVPAALT